MMRYTQSILILFSLFLLWGCERAFMDGNPANTPQANFQSLYETVGDKYSFFQLKGIDWDSVRVHYQPLLSDEMTDQALFDVLDSMLYDLRDGHVNLVSPFDIGRNWDWYLDYPVNFNFAVVERNYLGPGHQIAGGLRYTVIDSIGYVYYSSFSGTLSQEGLDNMLALFEGTKGVIIDVRDNGGGFLSNAFVLASRFVNEDKTVLRTFEKTGPGANDFGNGLSYSLGPSSAGTYDGPVAVLTNRSCYSATNTFAALMSNYDHVTLIGDQTGGGGGLPIDYELPNGWRYRFSATISLLPNDYDIELGIPPNIRLDNDPETNAAGVDQILERALQELR